VNFPVVAKSIEGAAFMFEAAPPPTTLRSAFVCNDSRHGHRYDRQNISTSDTNLAQKEEHDVSGA